MQQRYGNRLTTRELTSRRFIQSRSKFSAEQRSRLSIPPKLMLDTTLSRPVRSHALSMASGQTPIFCKSPRSTSTKLPFHLGQKANLYRSLHYLVQTGAIRSALTQYCSLTGKKSAQFPILAPKRSHC